MYGADTYDGGDNRETTFKTASPKLYVPISPT